MNVTVVTHRPNDRGVHLDGGGVTVPARACGTVQVVNVALLTSVAITLVLVVIWAFPSAVLLKQKYVLFVVGLTFAAGGVLTLNGAGVLSMTAIVVGLIVWIVAAVRLAPPASRWAKQLYGETKATTARERPAGATTLKWERRHGQRTPVVAPAPAPPRPLVVGAALTVVGMIVVGTIGGVAGGVAPGAALPVLWLVRAGWRRGRMVVTVLAVLAVANTVYNLTGGGAAPLPFWIAFAVGAVLIVGGQVLHYRNPTATYLAEATR
ncbi:hypothetical protein [Pseudonocardia endophytica]|uniref:Uncharacterized protein n=1 Tax=Pseudonocardia endophytica TaxID=401976 RepID=A0A4R1HV49_PSEEN|nr:hypothetical protein [Pseudonocardia endophytica]TCK26138.1 hypothetical protein EV378_1967 [Pseudonocardia endophytica]